MHMIEFWIMRKGEDARKVAPEVGDAILRHPGNGKYLFCGDGHKIVAVIAFCWREPDADLYTAGICIDCEARHSDEQLAEKTQQEVFADRVARLLSIERACDQMESEGLLKTVGIDPITGSKRRQLTSAGREQADVEAQAEQAKRPTGGSRHKIVSAVLHELFQLCFSRCVAPTITRRPKFPLACALFGPRSSYRTENEVVSKFTQR